MKTTVLVSEVKKIKEGTGQHGPWKLYHLIDGNGVKFSTFNPSLAKEAKELEGEQAELEYEEDGKGKKFTAIAKAASENGDTPPLGTGEYVTGQKPPIEVRRIFASTAWNCAARMAGADLGFDAAQNLADKIFADLLRKGKAMDDEDIPFG